MRHASTRRCRRSARWQLLEGFPGLRPSAPGASLGCATAQVIPSAPARPFALIPPSEDSRSPPGRGSHRCFHRAEWWPRSKARSDSAAAPGTRSPGSPAGTCAAPSTTYGPTLTRTCCRGRWRRNWRSLLCSGRTTTTSSSTSTNSQSSPPDSRIRSWSSVRFSRSVVRGAPPSVSSSRFPSIVKMRTSTDCGDCSITDVTSASGGGSGRSLLRNIERSRFMSRRYCGEPVPEASKFETP
jgi:hypothetical protein